MASEKYQAYLCSREWGLKREAVIERSGGECERCHENPGDAVHHKTYARVYNEPLTDLIHLCNDCHEFMHGRSDYDPMQDEDCSDFVFDDVAKWLEVRLCEWLSAKRKEKNLSTKTVLSVMAHLIGTIRVYNDDDDEKDLDEILKPFLVVMRDAAVNRRCKRQRLESVR